MKLGDDQGRWMLDKLIFWKLELVRRLEASEDKIMHDVNHCLDHIIRGFVIEFTVNTSVSYSEAERRSFKGP